METTTQTAAAGLCSLVHDYAIYNRWANHTLVKWVKTKPEAAVLEPVPSSFPGIRETLVHIWDTERFWLSVIRQEPAPVSFRMNGFDGSLQEVFEGLEETSRQLEETVCAMDLQLLNAPVVMDTPWVKGVQARYEFIQHCMNHSTYHRGQVTAMGHHVGLHDAPMTDFCFYLLREKNAQHASAV